MNMSNYLDLGGIIQNELIGDVWLTLIIGSIFIWILTLKKGLPNTVGILLTVVWIGIMFAANGSIVMIAWIFVVMGVGVLLYYTVAKALGRT